MDRIDTRICLQILEAWQQLKSIIETYAASRNLTLQQIFVLYHLYSEDHILMGTLAKQLHCDASNVTGMIDRLEVTGLITRQALPADRRAKQLTITATGRELIDNLIPYLPAGLGLQKLASSEQSNLHCILAKLTS